MTDPSAGRVPRWPLLAIGAALTLIVAVGQLADVPSRLDAIQRWMDQAGSWAPVAYVALYTGATLVGVPGLPFTLLAPFVFGVATGTVVMVVASSLSAAAAFLIARYVARGAFERRLAGTRAVRRLEALLDEHHSIVIPMLRVVPLLPFAVVNYGFGLTGISFWRYFAWSELAMIPVNAVLVLGASSLYRAAMASQVSWPLLGATAAAALVVLLFGLLGKRALATSKRSEA